jgi:potassium/hydrogen antiporter
LSSLLSAEAHDVFNIVFFVTLASVLVQGPTIPLVARLLGVGGAAFYPPQLGREEADASWLVEYLIPESSAIVGRELAKIGLPDGARALLVGRHGRSLVPAGRTRRRHDDTMMLLVDEEAEASLAKRSDLERLPGPVPACEPGLTVPPPTDRDEARDIT